MLRTPIYHLGDIAGAVSNLGTQTARENWEDLFNKAYVQPVLEVHIL